MRPLGDLLGKVLGDQLRKEVEEAAGKIKEGLKESGVDLDSTTGNIKEEIEKAKEKSDEKNERREERQYGEYTAPTLIKKHTADFPLAQGALGSDFPDTGDVLYFKDLIEKNMPGLAVTLGVETAAVCAYAPAKNVPIDLLVSRGGTPVAALFLVGKNSYKREAVIYSMNACENSKIPALRFIREFSNKPEYVIGRIQSVL